MVFGVRQRFVIQTAILHKGRLSALNSADKQHERWSLA